MGHRVLRPAVARLQFHGAPALRLCTLVVTRLFESESMHAQDRVIAGHRLVPHRQCARDAVSQHTRVASEEVHLMSDLQRERVARVVDGQIFEDRTRLMPMPTHQRTERCNVALFARRTRKRICRLKTGLCDRLGRAFC